MTIRKSTLEITNCIMAVPDEDARRIEIIAALDAERKVIAEKDDIIKRLMILTSNSTLQRVLKKFVAAYEELLGSVERIDTLRLRIEKLKELIDGCLPVVESWTVISQSQADWKKKWIEDARQVLLLRW